MAQNIVMIDGSIRTQPFDMKYSLETTDGSGTTRTIEGKLKGSPLFVIEAYNVTYKRLTTAQTSELLQAIIRRPSKPTFELYCFSPFTGTWTQRTFYCTAESLNIVTLKDGSERLSDLSVQFVGVNPVG